MKRTWARFEAVMKQGSEGEMAALPPGNPEGEKRGPGAVKRSTKPCSGESQSEKHDEARDSPRMRGKLALPIGMSLQPWITPAHAGKTHIHQDKIRGLWDHPRTCGENVSIHSQNLLHSGSPPRVRGKHYLLRSAYRLPRITPACAGKTGHGRAKSVRHADHPRACGENQAKRSKSKQKLGSPPRMRGKRTMRGLLSRLVRITPAHAGKTRR